MQDVRKTLFCRPDRENLAVNMHCSNLYPMLCNDSRHGALRFHAFSNNTFFKSRLAVRLEAWWKDGRDELLGGRIWLTVLGGKCVHSFNTCSSKIHLGPYYRPKSPVGPE